MKRKWIITIILAVLLPLAIATVIFAGSPGTAAAQAMPTATPAPLVTPVTSTGTTIPGMGAMSCPMMSGGMASMQGMGTMPGMGTMQNTSATMGNMNSMGNMYGMSTMSSVSDRYIILSDPTTWINGNPWTLLGWIVLFLVLLTILAAFGLGVFYLARRITQSRPAPKG